ncbi:dTDP-4-amino-4,6-dideoxygalactose transaminase [Candidatus Neomarinimicrobiota bacterium]
MIIPFNKPYLTGKETEYIIQAAKSGQISGNGKFTKSCHKFFEQKYNFTKVLLTTSCTDALEMCALLLNIKPGDEIIIPSYTFVSTALAFARQGAKIVFADSLIDSPNMDVEKIEELITDKTKAIVPVHYAGIAVDMDKIKEIADKYNLFVIEDAAHAIDSYYRGKPLGSIGHLAAFSFHETKNVVSGEGGMLVINDERFINRAEIIWEKGTNRAEFFRGEINKYSWVDIGSSFLPSDIIAAFLFAQLENMEKIQEKRISIWNLYYEGLKNLKDEGKIKLPLIPTYATNNGHMFYIVCRDLIERSEIINRLKENNILAVFHYLSLHKSPFYEKKYYGVELPNADRFANCIVRLPFYFELSKEEIEKIILIINEYYKKNT